MNYTEAEAIFAEHGIQVVPAHVMPTVGQTRAIATLDRIRNRFGDHHARFVEEAAMANTLFDSPLFVKRARYVQELGSLEDVFDLLDDWPAEKRDATYEILAKACRMADQGIFPLPAIRENVRRFLLKQGVLTNLEEVPPGSRRTADRNLCS